MLHRILLLSLLTAGLARADVAESYTETRPLDATGLVRVSNVNGPISIRTWDRPEVSVEVSKSATTDEELKAIRVEIESSPASFSLKTINPRHEFSWYDLFHWSWTWGHHTQVSLTLMVPASAALDRIDNVNGRITVAGSLGAVNLSTVNGAISATGLRGGNFHTVNGSISAHFDRFEAGAHLAAATVNGAVDLQLPRDVAAQVSASTVNGRISCEFPIRGKTGGFPGRSLRGEIGTGGGSIRVSTVNGGVSLASF